MQDEELLGDPNHLALVLQDERRPLGEALLAAADLLRQVFTRAVAAEGLTFMEGRALRLALLHGQQSALVDVLGVAPSRVSTMLRTLERRGYLARQPARGDRRQRDLEVTPAGLAVLQRIFRGLDERSPLMVGLDRDEREALHALVLKVLEAGGEPPR